MKSQNFTPAKSYTTESFLLISVKIHQNTRDQVLEVNFYSFRKKIGNV